MTARRAIRWRVLAAHPALVDVAQRCVAEDVDDRGGGDAGRWVPVAVRAVHRAVRHHQVLEAAARLAEPADVLGHRVRIVPRGALVALKFQAAISPLRPIEDRYQDVADIGRILTKRFDPEDERTALAVIGLAYPGADVELAALIDDLRNGRTVKI